MQTILTISQLQAFCCVMLLIAFLYCLGIGILFIFLRVIPEWRMMKNAAKIKEENDRIYWEFEDDIKIN